jgi:hypothetical protein
MDPGSFRLDARTGVELVLWATILVAGTYALFSFGP